MMNVYVIYSILASSICLFLAGFVYLKGKDEPVKKSFALVTALIGIWTLFPFISSLPEKNEIAIFLVRSIYIFAIFVPSIYLKFMLHIMKLSKDTKDNVVLRASYIISTLFAIFAFSPIFIKGVLRFKPYFTVIPGPLYVVFILYFGFMYFYAVSKLVVKYKESIGYLRMQLRYVGLAFLIAFISGVVHFLSAFGVKEIFPHDILVASYNIIMAYAIVKYRLMDITLLAVRTLIFIVVYGIILVLPVFTFFSKKSFMDRISIISYAFLASVAPFIYIFLLRRAEDIILKEQRRYQHALRELSKTMTRIRDLDELLKTVTSTIKDTVKVNYSAIYIKEEQYNSYRLKGYQANGLNSKLEEFIPIDAKLVKLIYSKKMPLLGEEAKSEEGIPFEFGLITPYFMEDELLGFLILGSKPNNQMYTPDDVLVFETLSYSTSLAIENSTFWKEIEDRQRKARLQEMDTYSYSLAHEIDNPMQVVLGQAGLLKKEVTDNVVDEEKRKEIIGSFDFILEAAKRVSGMVKAIRDFGQKTTGEFKALNIEGVVESFIKLYYPQFKDNAVFFEKVSNLKEPVFVRGEKPELMQVLVILANNSIHAMTGLTEKKAVLTLSLSSHELVKIAFFDNGYGIKKENLEIIFTPFTTTKASTEGTGMGLYNAKKIIDRHKGKIRAESEGAGKGATFFIELPIARDITEEELNKENKSSKRLI